MKEVPNIISTKDLSYIKDMASWNLVMAKKINSYITIFNKNKKNDANFIAPFLYYLFRE